MAKIPTTSTTLLRDLAQDSQHARWGEFVARYEAEYAVKRDWVTIVPAMELYIYGWMRYVVGD
jgi:hypothetical protein